MGIQRREQTKQEAMEEAEGERGGRAYACAPPSPSPASSYREGGLGYGYAWREFRLDWWIVLLLVVVGWCIPVAFGSTDGGTREGAGRSLLRYREVQGNVSFQCSPSGPCLPCQYSEKNDEKYRCSETGYRIPLKCVEVKNESKETSGKQSLRSLKESQGGQQSYITYRSCLPAEAEEKLSVIGFEMIMVCLLLVSGPIVYIRQKRSIPLPGISAMRIPSSLSRL